MSLKIKKNTIVVTVGPSNCGKSYWCENNFLPIASGLFETVHYISSDNLRRMIIGSDLDKHDSELFAVSDQAFNMLWTELESVISYPANQDIVVVDSTALSPSFHEKITTLAKKHHYNLCFVTFNYKNTKDYYSDRNNFIIKNHVRKFKETTLKSINSYKNFAQVYNIKSHAEISHEIIREEEPKNGLRLDNNSKYAVVGDIHGCYRELEEMLNQLRAKKFQDIILIGDIFDKNKEKDSAEKTINLIKENLDLIRLVRGNHDHFAEVFWTKKDTQVPQDILNKYFNDAVFLAESPELQKKFLDLLKLSYHWVETKEAIITHSPCQTKFLKKNSGEALRNQRNYRYRLEEKETLEDKLWFVDREKNKSHKKHIWGHIALQRAFVNSSNIGIDTGAVYGNCLTAVYFDKGRHHFLKVNSKNAYCDDRLQTLSFTRDIQIDEDNLKLASRMAKQNICYLSPTMCPADKTDTELESLDWAFNYYRKNGIEQVCLQPKFMGSRAQIYLYSDPEKCYGVTKNGYRFKEELNEILKEEYARLIEERQDFFSQGGLFTILDCEALPWRLLGEGLIDKSFYGYYHAASEHSRLRAEGNLDKVLNKLEESISTNKDFDNLTKTEYIEKYGHHKYSLSKGIKNIHKNYISVESQNAYLELFKKQVDIYGSDEPARIEPFAILKDVYTDGSTKTYWNESNSDMFSKINKSKSILLDLNNISEELLSDFQAFLKSNKIEGCVVKPDKVYNLDIAPYIKVRNPEYLRIVYGPDYTNPAKLDKLMSRKKIRYKLSDSIAQFKLAKDILEDPSVENLGKFLQVKQRGTNGDPRF